MCSLAAERPLSLPTGHQHPPGLGPQPRTRRPICWDPLRRLARAVGLQLSSGRGSCESAGGSSREAEISRDGPVPLGPLAGRWPCRQRRKGFSDKGHALWSLKAETTAPVQLWSAPCRRPGEGGSSCVLSTTLTATRVHGDTTVPSVLQPHPRAGSSPRVPRQGRVCSSQLGSPWDTGPQPPCHMMTTVMQGLQDLPRAPLGLTLGGEGLATPPEPSHAPSTFPAGPLTCETDTDSPRAGLADTRSCVCSHSRPHPQHGKGAVAMAVARG